MPKACFDCDSEIKLTSNKHSYQNCASPLKEGKVRVRVREE